MRWLDKILNIRVRSDLVDAWLHGPQPRPVNVGKQWGQTAEQVAKGKAANYTFDTSRVIGNTPTEMFTNTRFALMVLMSLSLNGAVGRQIWFGKQMPDFDILTPIDQPGLIYGGNILEPRLIVPVDPLVELRRGQSILGKTAAVFTADVHWNFYVPSLPE